MGNKTGFCRSSHMIFYSVQVEIITSGVLKLKFVLQYSSGH